MAKINKNLYLDGSLKTEVGFHEISPQTLAIRLTKPAEKTLLRTAHPWVFADSIQRINKNGNTGDVAILYRNDSHELFGVGLYDADSPIRIKMLHYYERKKIDRQFFEERIRKAFLLRAPLRAQQITGYRLLSGENDGFPEMIADVYADVLVIKLYSGIWYPYLKNITEILIDVSQCKSVVLRLSRLLQMKHPNGFLDGQVLYGHLKDEEVEFEEDGVLFFSNVVKGHKTGFFLDQRQNRRRVGEMASGKKVLDVFTYTGGFAVHALARGAREVTAVDISKYALELSKKNLSLNHYSGVYNTLVGDAFVILSDLIKKKRKFDLVVIDPPSFAKQLSEVRLALKKYRQLTSSGASLVSKGGILVIASCSSRVTQDEFFNAVERTLRMSGRKFELIEKTFHDIDHPITFKEAAYLKCGFYRID